MSHRSVVDRISFCDQQADAQPERDGLWIREVIYDEIHDDTGRVIDKRVVWRDSGVEDGGVVVVGVVDVEDVPAGVDGTYDVNRGAGGGRRRLEGLRWPPSLADACGARAWVVYP